MRKTGRRLLCLLTACCLLAALCPALTVPAAAETVPEAAELAWDMENLPQELFDENWAMNVNADSYGHTVGMTDATRAEGKGVNGTTALAMTYTKEANAGVLWGCGMYLRICEDETADNNWLGVTEVWFWMDASECKLGEVQLDYMIDGMHPKLDVPYWLIQDGKRTEQLTVATYNNAPFGRLVLPKGFVGWIGMPISDFNTTYGVIQNIGLACFPVNDTGSFPLSVYVDEFRVVREDTSGSALLPEGELFNKDTPAGDYSLYTNLTDVHQIVKSYGASGSWWTTAAGTLDFVDGALKLIFTDEGAGLNNYRHNIGGSVKADLSDAGANMTLGRAVPSPLTEDGKYDEDKDIGGYTVLMKLVEMGTIDDFTLYMNTPPSTMTNNGLTYCDPWGDTSSNLREDCYEAYASYVVDMVQLYNYLGVPVSFISPVNEPQWDWTGGGQEGCHYSADETQRIIELVSEKLVERCKEDSTLENVRISFAESGTWTDKSYVNYLYLKLLGNQEAATKYAHIGCHSYGTDADAKMRVAKEMANMGAIVTFRETEYGPNYEQADFSIKTGIEVARVMYEDLSILDVDAWSYWLAVGGGNYTDGLVYYNRDSNIVQQTKRLWAMGQYARFTKGATRVGVDEYGMPSKVYTTAYVNNKDDTLVYVVVNDNAADQTFSFKGLPAGSTADVYETSAIRNLSLRGTMSADSGYTLPAQSITTFVFHGIDLPSVVSGSNPDNPTGMKAKEDFDYSVFEKGTVVPTPVEPTEPTEPAEPAEQDDNGSNTKTVLLIGGIVLGVLVLAAAAWLLLKRRKKTAGEAPEEEETTEKDESTVE